MDEWTVEINCALSSAKKEAVSKCRWFALDRVGWFDRHTGVLLACLLGGTRTQSSQPTISYCMGSVFDAMLASISGRISRYCLNCFLLCRIRTILSHTVFVGLLSVCLSVRLTAAADVAHVNHESFTTLHHISGSIVHHHECCGPRGRRCRGQDRGQDGHGDWD